MAILEEVKRLLSRRAGPGAEMLPAAASREVSLLLAQCLEEMSAFGVPADRFIGEMARLIGAAAVSIEARRLEEAREHVKALRAQHQEALDHLLKRTNAVDVMKVREIYRHLFRAAESLSRCIRFLGEHAA